MKVVPLYLHNSCHFMPIHARRATKSWAAVQRSMRVSAKAKKATNDQRNRNKQTKEAERLDTVRQGEEQEIRGVQLSRSGKEMGWKLFPKEEDSDVNAAHASDNSQQDVGVHQDTLVTIQSHFIFLATFSNSSNCCCRCCIHSRKQLIWRLIRKTCLQPPEEEYLRHASKRPLCCLHLLFF